MMNINPSNPKILRPLHTVESFIDEDQKKGRAINPRVFLLASHIDIFVYQERFLRAVELWMHLHPLLRCVFLRDQTNDYLAEISKEEQARICKEIAFLRFFNDDPSGKFNGECWKLLYEREFHLPLDSEKKLWRAILLELPKDGALFKYAFIITIHHSITDGRNAFLIVRELLSIFEDIHYGIEEERDLNFDNKRANNEFDLPNDPRKGEKTLGAVYKAPAEAIVMTIIPEYVRPKGQDAPFEEEKKGKKLKEIEFEGLKYNDGEDILEKGVFKTMEGSQFATAKDILQSRRNFFTRVTYLDIPEGIFKLFSEKVADHKQKFNGCFEVIIALAWRNTCRRFSGDENVNPSIKYQVPINLRPYLEPAIDDSTMGVWVASFIPDLKIEEEEDKNESLFWGETFWELSKKRSEMIQAHIKERPFFKKETLEAEQNTYHMLKNGLKFKDVIMLYAVSNIGKMDSTSNDIKILEHHEGLSYTEDFFITAAYHGLCTIGERLCWGIVYNKGMMRVEVVNEWKNKIFDVFEKVTKY